MPLFDKWFKGRHFTFMDTDTSPFHKIRGWKILLLLAITILYSIWYTGIGPFGQLSALGPGLPLEERLFYTGEQAVAALSQLDDAGRMVKFTSLVFDVPYMILNYLLFEALIAFGLRRLSLTKAVWSLLFVLPIAFLLADFSEDSFIALTLATGSVGLGSVAGVMTFVKMMTFTAASLTGLILSLLGLFLWVRQGRP